MNRCAEGLAAARIRGHGLIVTPEAPYVARRTGAGPTGRVIVEHAGQEAVIAVNDTTPGTWLIDFDVYTITWPEHFALTSAQRSTEPFELWHGDGAGIFVHGPLRQHPILHHLATPGQEVIAGGRCGATSWIELAYHHDGAAWTQRHHLLPTGHLVTYQARQDAAEHIRLAAEGLCAEMIATAPNLP